MDRAQLLEEVAEHVDSEPAPPRNPLSRMSFGHVVMIVAGLVAVLLNIALLRSGEDTVEVLVAARPIAAGNRLVVADIVMAEIAADSPFVDRVLNQGTVEPLLGQIVTRDIASGAPLLADDLRPGAAPDAGRAMSIPISPTQAVAADVRRGDRVDVISVVDGTAVYVATALEVLAVADTADGRLATTSDFSITVAIDDQVALLVASALDIGDVHIIRSTGAPAPAIDESADQ